MSSSNIPQSAQPRMTVTFADWGAAYKIALGVIGVGVFIVVWAPFVGGVLMEAVSPALESLAGAPPDRDVFAASNAEAGVQVLTLLGMSNIIVGICLFGARLVLELLGLAGEPMLTRRIRPRGKLALGAATAAALVLIASMSSDALLALLMDDESAIVNAVWALGVAAQVGWLLMASSIITLALWRQTILLRWLDAIGWGKPHWGWLNRLSVAMVVAGVIGGLPLMPFDDTAYPFAAVGATIFALGIIPQMFARARP